MFKSYRPTIKFLNEELLEEVVSEAFDILENIGIFVENAELFSLFKKGSDIFNSSHYQGVRIDHANNRVFIPQKMVEEALETVPSMVKVYDREGKLTITLEGENVYFNPGSTATKILDPITNLIRPAETKDYVTFTMVVDALKHIKFQSTAIICSDVPEPISDRYRLYLSLLFSSKPIVTGTFRAESFEIMKKMLLSVRNGDVEELRKKPLAIFDVCPSPPLKWSNLGSQTLIDCAKAGIPIELVSMPISGAVAPVTLLGSLVQHTAENLSGIVISQLLKPGSSVIYGGSPSIMEMWHATTPMAAIESIMMNIACSQVGKYVGLPTHGYLGLSDAKTLDEQCFLEAGISIISAALAGINVVSGPGMLNFESCQSVEKLVIDHEACGMAYRLIDGFTKREKIMVREVLKDFEETGELLSHKSTRKWFKKEFYFPSVVVDRSNLGAWIKGGRKTARQRAMELIKQILAEREEISLDGEIVQNLKDMMEKDASLHGLNKLPKIQ